MIAIENTHMVAGGRATPAEATDAVAALGPSVHLDGARLFNAEVALGVPVARLAGEGVLAAPLGRAAVRLVTHLDVDDAGIDRAVEVLSRLPIPR